MAGAKIALTSVSGELQNDGLGNARVNNPLTIESAGYTGFASVNDEGVGTGTGRYVLAPETDDDYRLRVAQDTPLDMETFNYTAQNTGKFNYTNTTLTATWSASGMLTNGSSITTTTTGLTFGTYKYFPMIGPGILSCEMEAGFSNTPVSNTIIDFGLFIRGAANPYAPADGVYFRLNSAGLHAVINSNGTETVTGPFTFTITPNHVYQFIIATHERETEFWIDNVLYARVATPSANGQPFMAAALPFSIRHAITGGAAGAVIQMQLKDYNVSKGGLQIADRLGSMMNRMVGSYEGLSGGTMGTLANYANSANPTAAVPTNTTAALGTGLGGQFWETATIALTTDGIICSYQVPAGTANVQGRRLVIRGVGLTSYIQTVMVGGPFITQYSLAFGHTAVSLATAEAATTKAPRRIALSSLTQVVTAAQAVSTMVSQPGGSFQDFGDAPVYVNPGEFVALVAKKVGTVGTSGVIGHVVYFAYTWE